LKAVLFLEGLKGCDYFKVKANRELAYSKVNIVLTRYVKARSVLDMGYINQKYRYWQFAMFTAW